MCRKDIPQIPLENWIGSTGCTFFVFALYERPTDPPRLSLVLYDSVNRKFSSQIIPPEIKRCDWIFFQQGFCFEIWRGDKISTFQIIDDTPSRNQELMRSCHQYVFDGINSRSLA